MARGDEGPETEIEPRETGRYRARCCSGVRSIPAAREVGHSSRSGKEERWSATLSGQRPVAANRRGRPASVKMNDSAGECVQREDPAPPTPRSRRSTLQVAPKDIKTAGTCARRNYCGVLGVEGERRREVAVMRLPRSPGPAQSSCSRRAHRHCRRHRKVCGALNGAGGSGRRGERRAPTNSRVSVSHTIVGPDQ